MRASTAFLVGVGTVGLAVTGGLGGGLVIGNMMNPSEPKHAAEVAPATAPQPMPASASLPYVGATLAFSDPSIDGSAPPAADRHADGSNTSPQVSAPAAVSSEQAAESADGAAATGQPAQEAQQALSAKQTPAPGDAYAKAGEADLKHSADKRRTARAHRWAHRHDQQARDDRNDGGGDGPSYYPYNRSDRRYRDNDDRAPGYYVEGSPRLGYPRGQLFGPDD